MARNVLSLFLSLFSYSFLSLSLSFVRLFLSIFHVPALFHTFVLLSLYLTSHARTVLSTIPRLATDYSLSLDSPVSQPAGNANDHTVCH